MDWASFAADAVALAVAGLALWDLFPPPKGEVDAERCEDRKDAQT
jgi:hypothetical protein